MPNLPNKYAPADADHGKDHGVVKRYLGALLSALTVGSNERACSTLLDDPPPLPFLFSVTRQVLTLFACYK